MSLKYTSITIQGTKHPKTIPNQRPARLKLQLPKRWFGKKTKIFLIVLTLLLVTMTAHSFWQGRVLLAQLKKDQTIARELSNALNDQDFALTATHLSTLQVELQQTEKIYKGWGYLAFIPGLNFYYQDGVNILEAAQELSLGAKTLSAKVSQELGALDFKSGKGGTVESFLPYLLEIMPSLTSVLPEVSQQIENANGKIKNIDLGKYPQKFMGREVRPNLELLKNTIVTAQATLPELKDILAVVPEVLGAERTKTYLVLLQNDKELRSTGGFITAYAVSRVSKGRLVSIYSDDIYNFDDEITPKDKAPDYVSKYMQVHELHLRDSNLSPDFVAFVDKFEEIYTRHPQAAFFDGVIAIDTEFVIGLLEVLGEVTTSKYSETFSSKINEEYQIPDALYKLELYSENLLAQNENRKDLIADLMDVMLKNTLKLTPEKWPALFSKLGELSREKHVLGYSKDQSTQKLLEHYNFAGRVKDYEGDYLYLNENNFASRKANLYIQEKITQDIKIDKDGTITKAVTVTLTNPKPYDGWLNSTYLDYMRFYVPKGSILKTSQNLEDIATSHELGKTVFSGRSVTKTQSTTTVTLTYQLPFKWQKGTDYAMLIQKQPGSTDIEMEISLNGRQTKVPELTTEVEGKKVERLKHDTQINLKP